MANEKKQQRVSLIGNATATSPQIVRTNQANVEAQNVKEERGKAIKQIIAAFIANIGTINTGLIFGFSAVVIPQLRAATSEIAIDESQASWIASLSSLSTPIGCLMSGYLMDNFGRKKALLITEIPLMIGWATLALATSVPMLYVGRLLTGLGSGMVGAPSRVYTSEITQPHLRGMLTALSSAGLSFGVLIQYTMGAFLSWKMLSALSCLVPVCAFIGMLALPETPNYLVSHQKPEKASKSLAKLRGSSYNLQKEIDTLQNFANKTNAKKNLSAKETFQALLEPACLKPFAILVIYFMMYQFSGVNTITFYAVQIFQESGTSMDKNTATIVLGALRFVFTLIACILLRRSGRRPLSFVSGIGCSISMFVLSGYMFYKEQQIAAGLQPEYTWIPVASIFTFIITCTLGFLVVPWVMIGELYPMKVRGVLGGMTLCMAHSFVFIVVKTFPFFCDLVKAHGVYLGYGVISFLGTIFFYFFLPETKGKTLQEIEDYFSGRTTKIGGPAKTQIENNLLNNNNNNQVILTLEREKLLNK